MNNPTSLFTVLILLAFIKILQVRKHVFMDTLRIDTFFRTYAATFALLTGLFFFTLFGTFPEMIAPEHLFATVILTLFFSAIVYLPLGWLWNKFPNAHGRIVFIMIAVLSCPFIGIFAIESTALNGGIWFYGAIIIAFLCEIASEVRDFNFRDFFEERW